MTQYTALWTMLPVSCNGNIRFLVIFCTVCVVVFSTCVSMRSGVSTVFCSGESVFFRFSAHLLAAHRMSLLIFSMTFCFFRQIYNGGEHTVVTFGYFG